MRVALALLLALVPSLACTVEPPELEGLECPCANGWHCDDPSNTCVRMAAVESVCGRVGAEPGRVLIQDFRSEWETSNQIRWGWTLESDEFLGSYEIDLAPSEEDLVDGTHVVAFTSTDNPELARSLLPANGVERVLESTTRGLSADTVYVARLIVIDTSGGVTCSTAVSARTSTLPDFEIVLVEDAEPTGVRLPPCFGLQMDPEASFGGSSAHFAESVSCECYPPDCALSMPICSEPLMPGPTCWENLRFQDMGVDVSSLTPFQITTAYLEFAVAIEDPIHRHAFWSEVTFEDDGLWLLHPITFVADGEYHLYQFPLTAFFRGENYLTPETMADTMGGFRMGGGFSHGATVRIDSARIRY